MPRSSAKSSASAAALGFSKPEAPRSAAAGLARLEGAVDELRAMTIAPMLRRAIDALRAEDIQTGSELALKALEIDPKSGMAWYVLAVARERAGDFTELKGAGNMPLSFRLTMNGEAAATTSATVKGVA